MFGSNTTVDGVLLLVVTASCPIVTAKGMIVCNIFFDDNTMLRTESLELVVGLDCFGSGGANLMAGMNKLGCKVNEDGSPIILLVWRFTTEGVW